MVSQEKCGNTLSVCGVGHDDAGIGDDETIDALLLLEVAADVAAVAKSQTQGLRGEGMAQIEINSTATGFDRQVKEYRYQYCELTKVIKKNWFPRLGLLFVDMCEAELQNCR